MSLRRSFRLPRAFSGPFAVLALCASQVPACSQTPTVVPIRSMERPKDFDVICLHRTATGFEGAPRERCAMEADAVTPRNAGAEEYRLHSVVTQVQRGELAVADLGRSTADVPALVKVDPWLPGMTFLPVGAVPTDVAADPEGAAVYVSSGRVERDERGNQWTRIDIIPANVLRGPIDTSTSRDQISPWPALLLDAEADGIPTSLTIVSHDDDVVPGADGTTPKPRRLYVVLPEASPRPKIAVFDLESSPLMPARLPDIELTDGAATKAALAPPACPNGDEPWWKPYDRCAVSTSTQAPSSPVDGGAPDGQTLADASDAALDAPETDAPETDALTASPPSDAGSSEVAISTGSAPVARPSDVAWAGGLLFVSDSALPVIHVLDVHDPSNVREVHRIGVDAPLEHLSISPIVPDEVNVYNGPAISLCELNGWLGDGVDHSADSPLVRERLGGFCRAHRYIYAIDRQNFERGDGSILALDLPVQVTWSKESCTQFVEKEQGQASSTPPIDPTCRAILHESFDFANTRIEQPSACAWPGQGTTSKGEPMQRLLLGVPNQSITGPVRAITFVKSDRPTSKGLLGLRCRPQRLDEKGQLTTTLLPDELAVTCPEGHQTCQSDYREGMEYWASYIFPRDRLRGVYAFALLANGQLVVIDVDDYDASCRGATSSTDLEAFANRSKSSDSTFDRLARAGVKNLPGDGTQSNTGEFLRQVSRRHQTRIAPGSDGKLTPDKVPSITTAVLSRQTASGRINVTAANSTDIPINLPRLQPLLKETTLVPNGMVLPSPDSPFALTSETWTVTYQGILTGFGGAAGSLQISDQFELLDPAGNFCGRGVEAEANTPIRTHDFVQLTGDVCDQTSCCESGNCSVAEQQRVRDECIATFGSITDVAIPPTVDNVIVPTGKTVRRDLVIAQAFSGKLVLDDHDMNGTLIDDEQKAQLKKCFPGLTRYVVRARDSWVVIGSVTGYLHDRIVDPDPKANGACMADPSQPRIHRGRVHESPPIAETQDLFAGYPVATASEIDNCLLFVNPSVRFAIRTGARPSGDSPTAALVPQPTERDMRFSFGVTFPPTGQLLGLSLSNVGSMPQTVSAISYQRRGVEMLSWGQFGIVDAIDTGFSMYSLDNLRSYRTVN